MPLDGIYLNSIKKELLDLIINCKIDKINQPEKDEIHLTFNKNRKNHKLLISASSTYPRIHITNYQKPNPLKPPMFCMILRKYLSNSRIVDISQIGLDRILKIDFESTDELGFNSIYSLIVEIMGRHSNITLIRARDNKVMDSIKHITPDINTYRSLYPGIDYIYPPKSSKLNILNYTNKNLENIILEKDFNENFFCNILEGVSKKLSKVLYKNYTNIYTDFSCNNLNKFLQEFRNNLLNSNFNFEVYSNDKTLKDFHCFSISENQNIKIFNTASETLDYFYYEKDKQDRLNSKSSSIEKLVLNNVDRCNNKIKIFTDTLEECKKKDEFQLKGELLTANIYNLKQGMSNIEVENYYTETLDKIFIKLDPSYTPSKNVQWYYKKYNKLKTSEKMAIINMDSTKEELEYLNSVLNYINNIESADEIEELREELVNTGYIKFSKKKSKKIKKAKPYHFVSSEGADIFVGKNNLQNDYLTLKFASKSDIWFHTKTIPGSHVIVKNNPNATDKTLEEAANLAAYYSKGRESSKVEVDYTEVKNIKKPNGAKPGMVIYYTNKTIIITPNKPNLELK